MWRQWSGSFIAFPPALLQVASVASPTKTVNSNFAQPTLYRLIVHCWTKIPEQLENLSLTN